MPMNMSRKQEKIFSEIRKIWLQKLLPLNGYFAGDLLEKVNLPDQSLLDTCRLMSDRNSIIDQMKKHGVVGEIGTQEGLFAEYILEKTQPTRLHLFDIDLAPLLKRNNIQLLSKSDQHQGDSSIELEKFSDEYFDWLYIDGDHSYMGVKRDIAVASRKIKPGGYLIFNDFTIWSPIEMIDYGIPYAVCDFLRENPWQIKFFALHSLGYHDIAIQRPI